MMRTSIKFYFRVAGFQFSSQEKKIVVFVVALNRAERAQDKIAFCFCLLNFSVGFNSVHRRLSIFYIFFPCESYKC